MVLIKFLIILRLPWEDQLKIITQELMQSGFDAEEIENEDDPIE